MSEQYLILHKVRGEPAFDIAQRLCVTDGASPCQPECGCWRGDHCVMAEKWIIPTSGHTAHPYKSWALSDLADTSDINHFGSHSKPYAQDDLPADWPDHYPAPTSTEPRATVIQRASQILAGLGLGPKAIRRRKV